MWFIVTFLTIATVGSMLWTLIQIIKPDWFFKSENEANLKRKRPWWYLLGGIIGLLSIGFIWVQAFQLKLMPVWIFTVVLTLGGLKPLGMVFFYDRFSGEVSNLVTKMQASKKLYWTMIAARALLSVVLLMTTLYFMRL